MSIKSKQSLIGFTIIATIIIFFFYSIFLPFSKKSSIKTCEFVATYGKNETTNAINWINKSKTLIFYAYWEKDARYQRNLQFFVDIGVEENENIDYVFIIQGGKVSVLLPEFKNVKIFKRENDCFDFGAYGAAFKWLGGFDELKKYSYFIFLNPSVVGPILPKYWPSIIHWSEIFTLRLKGNVHAVGTSLACIDSPNVESMAFAATFKALHIAYLDKVFICHKTKFDVIHNGEYQFSRSLIKNDLNLDTLLLMYGDIDWTNKKNWGCNNRRHPSRNGTYGSGMTIHPLETVFYKTIWLQAGHPTDDGKLISEAYTREVDAYCEWAKKRKIIADKKKNT